MKQMWKAIIFLNKKLVRANRIFNIIFIKNNF